MPPKNRAQKKGASFGEIGNKAKAAAKQERQFLGVAQSGLLKNEFSLFLGLRNGPGPGPMKLLLRSTTR
jgi:hypothetical protein